MLEGQSTDAQRGLRTDSTMLTLDDHGAVRALRWMLGIMVVTAAFAVVTGLAFSNARDATIGLIGLTIGLGLCAAFTRGHYSFAAGGATYAVLVIATGMIATGRGIHDLGVILFPFAIILGSLLLTRTAGIVAAAVAVLACVAVASLEAAGVLTPATAARTSIEDVVLMGVLMGAIALVARLLVDALLRALGRSRVSEINYREIFNATSEGIIVIEPESGATLDINAAALEMTGATASTFTTFAQNNFPSAAGSSSDFRKMLDLAQTAPQLGEWRLERDGRRPVWLEVTMRAGFVSDQTCILVVMRDVTEQRAAREGTHRSEKLQALGQLAGGIAHDFNNQLMGVLTHARLLRRTTGRGSEAQKSLDAIIQGAERSADLTRQLLAFARESPRRRAPVDLNSLVREVTFLLKRSVHKRISVSERLSESPLMTQGDASLLQNAFLNLALNARDAMPDGGMLSLSARSVLVSNGVSEAVPVNLPNGLYARVRVEDTGSGIDEDTMARVFEPFFTTKVGGTGMGLAAVYGTVQTHHGAIHVRSELGCGSAFTIHLPILTEGFPAEVDERDREESRFEGLRVLLADDDERVAKATKLLLELLGCNVVRCGDGYAAVERYREAPDDFDLVVLDSSMPTLSGSEALAKLRSTGAEVPVIAMSGHLETGEEILLSSEAQAFLPKPFDLGELADAIGAALGT